MYHCSWCDHRASIAIRFISFHHILVIINWEFIRDEPFWESTRTLVPAFKRLVKPVWPCWRGPRWRRYTRGQQVPTVIRVHPQKNRTYQAISQPGTCELAVKKNWSGTLRSNLPGCDQMWSHCQWTKTNRWLNDVGTYVSIDYDKN